jgi:signal peptidase II
MLIAGLAVFALDQWTKRAIARKVADGACLRLTSWMAFRRVANNRGHAVGQTMLLITLAAAIALIESRGTYLQSPAARVAVGLALGGAAANVYDRLRKGFVLDFIDFGWWPVFNLADAAITLGVTATLLNLAR